MNLFETEIVWRLAASRGRSPEQGEGFWDVDGALHRAAEVP
jgi:hypothetical protein